MEFKVENLCGFLIRSKLMSPDDMLAMRQRWSAEAKENATHASLFLKWLVTKKYATEYQANLLSRGHIDDFFLGEYKILERVGRGRMAGVYKAVHPSGQIVAIKVLPPSRAKNALTLARFEREARLSIKLKHPHVVRSFQVGKTKAVHYLVMEFLEGDTLEEVLQRRKCLPPAEAVRLVHQALLGLQHVHEQGIIHRDLKPANLMLHPSPVRGANETTAKSNIKILDIGLAREFFDENAPDASEQAELTGEGVLLGTPDYLAPEQARDPRTIDIRADIYSLGCTMYHMISGQPPFPDKNILNQMVRHATETAKPLQEFVPGLPEGLTQIVNWMIAKQPDQRYPTPMRAAQALDAFMMVTSEAPKPADESPQMRKYLTWLDSEDKKADDIDQPAPSPGVPAAPIAKPTSSSSIPVATARPASGSSIPIATAKPAAMAKPAAAEPRKLKRGADAPQVPTAAPAIPSSPAPATPAAPPLTADQFDVELVAIPDSPPAKAERFGKRDFLMLGIGIGATVISIGLCGIAWFIGQLFSGE